MSDMPSPSRALYQNVGLLLGPIVAGLVFFLFRPDGLAPEGTYVAAIALWMAIWWASEAIRVFLTATLPLLLFPVLGVNSIPEMAATFANPILFLFLGGFVIALGIQRSGLHIRTAITVFRFAGLNGRSLVGGFMLAAAVLSMWISNTSTTLMLLPIAASITVVIRDTMPTLDEKTLTNFQTVMILGLAYGATLGGVATLVGTPPNAFMAGFMADSYQIEIDFARWMLVGIPITLIMLPLAWLALTRLVYPINFQATDATQQHINDMRAEIGDMNTAEKRIGILFLILVLAWVLRKPLLHGVFGLTGVTDAGIAMTAAVLAFIIPSGKPREALVTLGDGRNLPWGVLLLFGGGLVLAGGMTSSGLTLWLGQQLAPLGLIHLAILVIASVTLVIFLTELTSNLATTATILPVMAAIAVETGHDPLIFVVPVTLAASCAFMLPVATPPNAIAYSSGYVTIPRMIRAGIVLNLIGVAILSLIAIFLVPLVFG